MSDCCCQNTSAKIKQICPECGSTCKSVGMPTLYHQVRFPENQSLITDNYYFCSAKICLVGYFSSVNNIIPKQHLRSYQAIQNDALCYCFDIDANQYLSALKAHCAKHIKYFVIQRINAGECACEIRNPSGQCCLANFKRLENE
ncbi:MAG: putative iron-sulfur cluster-binding metallochaperone [Methylobacter sp.]